MADEGTTVAALRQAMARFVGDREWEKFHSPKNLAMALAAEAAELMEHFLWVETEESRRLVADPVMRERVADEVADVACLVMSLCNSIGLDLSDEMRRKMARNELKYPVEKCRGHYRPQE